MLLRRIKESMPSTNSKVFPGPTSLRIGSYRSQGSVYAAKNVVKDPRCRVQCGQGLMKFMDASPDGEARRERPGRETHLRRKDREE